MNSIRPSLSPNPHQNLSIIGLLVSLLGIVLVGIVVIGISLIGIDNKDTKSIDLSQYNSELVTTQAADRPYFDLRLAGGLKKDSTTALSVEMDTVSKEVNGATLVLRYDKNKVKIDGTGAISNGSVFTTYSSTVDQTNGIVRISANFSPDVTRRYSGRGTFASINIVPLSQDSSDISVLCTQGETNDTNISLLGEDLIGCAFNNKLTLSNIAGVGGGSQSSSGGSSPTPPPVAQPKGCNESAPSTPYGLTANPTATSGQVKLSWPKVSGSVTHYTVTFGETGKTYEYGLPDIGNTDQFLVNRLRPGVQYNFVITANYGCATSGYSNVAQAKAGPIGYSNAPRPTLRPQPTVAPTSRPVYTPAPTVVPVTVTPMPTIAPTIVASPAATVKPTTTPIVYDPEEAKQEPSLLSKMGFLLPWFGLAFLGLLGGLLVLLIKYLRQQNTPDSGSGNL